jgi:hypothetical protein
VRAFFRFLAFAEPARSLQCQQVLAIPSKRHERSMVEFLAEEEMVALVAAPDTTMWIGRRDRARQPCDPPSPSRARSDRRGAAVATAAAAGKPTRLPVPSGRSRAH